MQGIYRLLLRLTLVLLGGITVAQAQSPRMVLFEDPTLSATRLHYPLLLSSTGRGYRLLCANQGDEEAVIRGLGFTAVPSQILTAVDESIIAADPTSNPLLCPSAADFQIQVFASDGPDGLVHYLQFPSAIGSTTFTDRLYIPGCVGLVDALKIDLGQAKSADPTPFFQGKIHEISCLNGTPVDVAPKDFSAWCLKGDRTPAETATVLAMLDATPVGISALGNGAACAAAKGFLSTVPSLNLNGKGVQSLAPLSVLGNLTSLSLAHNQISDLSPLTKMSTLTFLDLSDNKIATIVALAPLTTLTQLNLDDNQVGDIRFLSALSRLTSLSLNGNSVNDLSPLQFLQALTKLSLARNGLTGNKLEPLTALGALTDLDLSGNKIETFAHLGEFPSTVEIDLSRNPIVSSEVRSFLDLCVLHRDAPTPFGQTIRVIVEQFGGGACSAVNEKVLSTTTLDLSKKGISDVGPVGALTHLAVLNLSDNAISDVKALSGLVNLIDLNLVGNRITDIRPIGPLTKLTKFEASGNPISLADFVSACLMRKHDGLLTETQSTEVKALLDISHQTTCQEARAILSQRLSIDASNRGLSTLDYFSVLDSVKDINLSHNRITDLLALRPLRNLIVVVAANNKITKITSLNAVTSLHQLEALDLDNNPLLGLDGIAALTKLKRISFSNTAVQRVEPLMRLPLLEQVHMRTLPLNLLRFGEYCFVQRFDPIALGTDGLFMAAIETPLIRAGVDVRDCDAVEQWVRNLKTLTLNKKGIISIEPISFFTALEELYLYDNSIRDVGPISKLQQLNTLNLTSNRITALPRFQSTHMKSLYLNANDISDISQLSHLAQLTSLSVKDNKITNPSPLVGLPSVTWLDLRNNLIGPIGSVVSIIGRKPYLKGNPICTDVLHQPFGIHQPFAGFFPIIQESCRREPMPFIGTTIVPGIFTKPGVIKRGVIERDVSPRRGTNGNIP